MYNELRSYLPEIAALASNAPFLAGRDSGLASVRPVIASLLPRQTVPPVIDSIEAFADDLRWGAATGALATPGQWWWEMRPHPGLGTLELRVPDAQATLEHAGAIAAFAHCLVALLVRTADGDEPAPTWRIAENRWSAAHHGVEGELADLRDGRAATDA